MQLTSAHAPTAPTLPSFNAVPAVPADNNIKKHHAQDLDTLLQGSGFHDCLSARELDTLIEPVAGNTYVNATQLYLVRTGQCQPNVAHRRIHDAMQKSTSGIAIAPLHVRHHWTIAVFHRHGDDMHATILDSAPSHATAKDIRSVLKMIGVKHHVIICPGKQPRGSNECGVHAIVNAWRAFFDLNPYIADGTLDLKHLRAILAELATCPRKTKERAPHIAVFPEAPNEPGPSPIGAGPRGRGVATEASTAALNLCYLFAATSAIDLVKLGRVRTRTVADLCELQQRLQHPPLVQQDIAEVIYTLTGDDPEWENLLQLASDGGDSIRPQTRVILNPARRTVVIPPDRTEIAHVLFLGEIEYVGTHQFARKGHYVLKMGPHPPVPAATGPDPTSGKAYVNGPVVHILAAATTIPVAQDPDAAVAVPPPQPVPAAQPPPTPSPLLPADGPGPSVNSPSRRAAAAKVARVLRTSPAQLDNIIQSGDAAAARRAQERLALANKALAQKQVRAAPAQPVDTPAPASTSQPAPPIGRSSPPPILSRSAVKEFISQLTEGQTIFVHWAAGTDAGKWFGRVTRAGTQSIRVAFDVRLCDSCMAPRQASKPLAGVVPTPGMMYYAIERKQVPRVEPCVCADVPDPDDDAEMDGDDQPHADDFPNDFAVSAQIDRTVNASPEGQPLGELVHVPPGAPTADVSAGWYIPHGRPDWVHVLVWKQLAESTRLNHQRWLRTIKGMPADLRRGRSISHAVVEMVIRMASARKWVWSTVASALAACNAALASLPIYTNEQYSIKVGTDPYFQQASRMAQQKARATASLESLTAGLSQQQFEHLTSSDGIKSHRVRLLLQMMWYWASRPKEMREVRPCDIVIKQARPDGCSHVSITFHTGKVVPYCGPYTIHVILPKRVTCAVRAAVESVSPDAALFTTRDQAILAGVIGGLQGHGDGLPRLNLRSIRRGSVLHLAASGVRDVELQLLTGHKRMDTLMRYLGWGRESATMREAAAARQQADAIRGAGADSPILPTQHQPPKMGPHSGYVGNKGRRVLPPPKFFPRKMPSAEDCGVSRDHIDTSDYTLHIKETSRVDWTAVSEMADRTPLQPEVLLANRWCTSPAFYGPRIVIEPRKIPATTCDPAQLEQLLRADKIRPHHGPINGFVNMFTIAQHNKKRLRVIAEPVINATCDREHIYKVKYPSRLERRARARGAKFEAELDFAAYFDQFELSPDVLSWFVVRSRHPIDGATLFTLTRLPMGVTFAPSVAQAVTSALVYPLLHMEGVTVDTCIDNIRVIAREPQQFVHAMRTLLGRIHTAKITLNDAHTWDVPDGELLQRCAVTEAPRIFLGEQYTGDTISNTPAAVDKLKAALVRFDEGCTNVPYTKRNFASLVGLMLFMTHTIGVDLARFHTLLRAYGRIIAETAGWDEPCLITSDAVRDQLKAMGEEILLNPRVPLPILEPPSRVIEHYDAAIEVDASGSAWGAIVRITATGDTFTLQQRWSVSMLHSARAEPTAALRAVQWIRAHLGRNASVAIITDHIAVASGQRRWNSAYGGFSSTGFHLNEFYRELYSNGGGQVFYVEGEDNRADGISRDPTAPFHLKVEKADLTFRDLGLVTHPFEVLPRKQYQV